MLYAYTENFMLPLSHDEVVHGKGSLLGKMPGDDWQRFANLRLLLAYQVAAPGKKLLFMGGEFGQWREWNASGELDWDLLANAPHAGMQRLVRDLNRLYARTRRCTSSIFEPAGFAWIDCHDTEQSVLAFLRMARDGGFVVVALNFTPVPRTGYRIGVPRPGRLPRDAEQRLDVLRRREPGQRRRDRGGGTPVHGPPLFGHADAAAAGVCRARAGVASCEPELRRQREFPITVSYSFSSLLGENGPCLSRQVSTQMGSLASP